MPINFQVCLAASGFLALQHLNNSSKALVPSLANRLLDSCDINFFIKFRNSEFSNFQVVQQLQGALQQPLKPIALSGGGHLSDSVTLATLALAYQIPQISPSSTSN
jgi:hypothetical protein